MSNPAYRLKSARLSKRSHLSCQDKTQIDSNGFLLDHKSKR